MINDKLTPASRQEQTSSHLKEKTPRPSKGRLIHIHEADPAVAENWPVPIPRYEVEGSRLYPVDALPPIIRDAVEEVTNFVQCPVALTACSAMSAISTAAAGIVDVHRYGSMVGPVSLFILAIARPGERKGSVDAHFTKAIRGWQLKKIEGIRTSLIDYEDALTTWEAERGAVLNKIRAVRTAGKGTGVLKDEFKVLRGQRPVKPVVPRLIIGDATLEALIHHLGTVWPVGSILSAEAGMLLGGHSMREDAIAQSFSTLNTCWDGGGHQIHRKTTGSFEVAATRLTLGLAVQPVVLKRFVDRTQGLAQGSGFLSRFLLAWPESRKGKRILGPEPKGWPARDRFNRRILELLNAPVVFDGDGALKPEILRLTPEATALWTSFVADIEDSLSSGGEMEETDDVADRVAENAARVAGLFHVIDRVPVRV